MAAMREVFEKVPSEIRNEMPNLLLFAPSPDIQGQVYPQISGDGVPQVFVYLSPELESENEQVQVTFTVAHELAHVYLGHYRMNHADCTAKTDEEAKLSYLEW